MATPRSKQAPKPPEIRRALFHLLDLAVENEGGRLPDGQASKFASIIDRLSSAAEKVESVRKRRLLAKFRKPLAAVYDDVHRGKLNREQQKSRLREISSPDRELSPEDERDLLVTGMCQGSCRVIMFRPLDPFALG